MSIQHYAPSDIIDISPFGSDFANAASETLIRESHIEVFRFVLKAGKSTPEHTRAAGAITIQCLEGQIALAVKDRVQTLQAQQLVYLSADEPHSVKALTDASLLVTILLKRE